MQVYKYISYLPLLTKNFTYKGRVNVGLYVYIFCMVMIFITHALCINSLPHLVSMLTENYTYICNPLSMAFVLRLAVIHSLRNVLRQFRSLFARAFCVEGYISLFLSNSNFFSFPYCHSAGYFSYGSIHQLGRRQLFVKISRSHKIRYTYRRNPLNE